MTLILGAKGRDGVYIGSDSRGTASDHYYFNGKHKLIRVKNFIVGYTASYRTAQVIEFNKTKFKAINSRKDMYKFVQTLKEMMIAEGSTDKGQGKEELEHDAVCLIVATPRKLYMVYGNYQFDEDSSFGIGSGGRYAVGYFEALDSEDTARKIKRTIAATSKRIASVGGKIKVLKA